MDIISRIWRYSETEQKNILKVYDTTFQGSPPLGSHSFILVKLTVSGEGKVTKSPVPHWATGRNGLTGEVKKKVGPKEPYLLHLPPLDRERVENHIKEPNSIIGIVPARFACLVVDIDGGGIDTLGQAFEIYGMPLDWCGTRRDNSHHLIYGIGGEDDTIEARIMPGSHSLDGTTFAGEIPCAHRWCCVWHPSVWLSAIEKRLADIEANKSSSCLKASDIKQPDLPDIEPAPVEVDERKEPSELDETRLVLPPTGFLGSFLEPLPHALEQIATIARSGKLPNAHWDGTTLKSGCLGLGPHCGDGIGESGTRLHLTAAPDNDRKIMMFCHNCKDKGAKICNRTIGAILALRPTHRRMSEEEWQSIEPLIHRSAPVELSTQERTLDKGSYRRDRAYHCCDGKAEDIDGVTCGLEWLLPEELAALKRGDPRADAVSHTIRCETMQAGGEIDSSTILECLEACEKNGLIVDCGMPVVKQMLINCVTFAKKRIALEEL